jgi:hypothetical protein
VLTGHRRVMSSEDFHRAARINDVSVSARLTLWWLPGWICPEETGTIHTLLPRVFHGTANDYKGGMKVLPLQQIAYHARTLSDHGHLLK